MQTSGGTRRTTLPLHWLRRVRSAIVHAISMASTAFAVGQGRAERSSDVRVQLRSDIDRLEREVALLKVRPSDDRTTEDPRMIDASSDDAVGAANRRSANLRSVASRESLRRLSTSPLWFDAPETPG